AVAQSGAPMVPRLCRRRRCRVREALPRRPGQTLGDDRQTPGIRTRLRRGLGYFPSGVTDEKLQVRSQSQKLDTLNLSFRRRAFARRWFDRWQLPEKALGSLRQRLEPFNLNLRARSHQIDQKRRQSGKIDLERSPVGPAPVDILHTVFATELPRTEQLAGAGEHLLVGGQRRHAAAEEQRRLRLEKVLVHLP